MNLSALFSSGFQALTFRFLLVGALPSTVFVLLLMALFGSLVLGEAPSLEALRAAAAALEGDDALLLALAVLSLSFLLEPLQLGMTRMLEGYWGDGPLGRLLVAPWLALQRRRHSRYKREACTDLPPADCTPELRARMESAGLALRFAFPSPARLLPTDLGNTLRAMEEVAGSRYGLDAVTLWPRLYPLLPAELREAVDDRRNQLDFAVRTCCLASLWAVVAASALRGQAFAWYFLPVLAVLVAWAAYRSAVAAARGYGELVQVAFDFHRHRIHQAFRLPVPANLVDELALNARLTSFLLRGRPNDFIWQAETGGSDGPMGGC